MYGMKDLERRIERLEREVKKIFDALALSKVVNPIEWKDISDLDKKIIKFLHKKKYDGATTTEIAKAVGLKDPESYGRTTVWRRLKRIEYISRRIEGSPIVVVERKRWRLNYDEFDFGIPKT